MESDWPTSSGEAAMVRARYLTILILILVTALLPSESSDAWIRHTLRQPYFKYCFLTPATGGESWEELNSNRKARFRDALQTWRVRAVLTWDEVSCSDPSALTVKMAYIDGPGHVAGHVIRNNLGNPAKLEFDYEDTWHDAQTLPIFNRIDFWGLAAHELGHVWGVNHGCLDCFTPEPNGIVDTNYPTMNTELRSAFGGEIGAEARDLTSDDEAGAHWAQDKRILPNHGFEHFQDSVSTVVTVGAWYWKGTGFARQCGDGLAQQGSCHVSTGSSGTAGAYIRQQLRHAFACCTAVFSFYARVGGTNNARIRVEIKDVDSGGIVANRSFAVPGGAGPWALYSFNFSWPDNRLRTYQFAVFSELTSPYTRIDFITFKDD